MRLYQKLKAWVDSMCQSHHSGGGGGSIYLQAVIKHNDSHSKKPKNKKVSSYNYITEDIFQLYTSGGSCPVSAELLPEINRNANGLFSTV